jgi:protein-tyrosine phosphatase
VTAGEELRRILREGGRIVLHCRGGLGRTGLVAARLLIEFGMAPQEAIRRVRAARPGAIQTREQEDYVRRCKR